MALTGSALIAHGGGPTQVINASLAGAIEESRLHPAITQMLGARHGTDGILEQNFVDLGRLPASLTVSVGDTPGSALGSSRRKITDADYHRLLRIFKERNIRYFFYTGGNGSMHTAHSLFRLAASSGYEIRIIGIPKTIDNDLLATDHTPGYGSAARFFACALRDIGEDNRALPTPVNVVEVLGRNAGWIVAATALARSRPDDPPHLIYLPERRLALEQLFADVESVYRRLKRVVVAVCEGQLDETGAPFGADVREGGGFQSSLAQNLAHTLSRAIEKRLGIRARSEKPGLLGRSSWRIFSESDREEARLCGAAAVRAAIEEISGKMITLEREPGPIYRCATGLADLEAVAKTERLFPDRWIAASGRDVAPEFLDYVRPLTGSIEAFPRF